MIIGIDLGTTNSLCAYFKDNEAHVIPNRLGEALTPSVVSIDVNGTISVGKTALEHGLTNPETCAKVFKRTMGTNKKYVLSGKEYSSEELSSFILKYLKEDAEHFLNEPIEEVIISVPAYFNDARRKATKRAGELAGLKVERIISEPTAAAIVYGISHREENTKFLVFDLGGGTFDVSIIELFHNILEVRAVAGDNYLGGEDFTKKLMEMISKKHEIPIHDLSPRDFARLVQVAEQCKCRFADENKVNYSYEYGDQICEGVINEIEYEIACEELLDKIKEPIKTSLQDAKIKIKDIDMVIMVGGATRLPIVYRYVSKLFRNYPNNSVDPDQAVALGAAIQGAMKERNKDIKEVILTDVCPFTLGTEVSIEVEENKFESGHYCPIIERNTVIPTSRTERLYTIHDNQTSLRIKVLQGESRVASNNLFLGELVIKVPKAKASEESVDITYTYDVNSILEIEVRVISTGETTKKILKMQDIDLSDEEIAARLEELSYLKIPPREHEENRLVLALGERLYEETKGSLRRKIEESILRFERVLLSREQEEIARERKALQDFLREIENS